MSYFPFAFTGPIARHALGSYGYTVIWLPDDIAAQLPLAQHPRLRISGELNDRPFEGAWQPSRGRWYLMLGKPLLKETGLAVDDLAELRFRIENQDAVTVPSRLEHVVQRSPVAASRWSALTPGKQRALSHHVLDAKTEATVERRVTQVLLWLELGETDLRSLPKLKS